MRKIFQVLVLLAAFACAAGCATRSISNSGYPGERGSYNPSYVGELSELDVLGLHEGKSIGEEDIRKALENRQEIRVRRGDPLFVVQSGALSPDEALMDELTKSFRPVPFSGIPDREKKDQAPYTMRLRFAAAQGGYTHILCVWGTLETAQEDKATKAISWVPIAGQLIPDQSQRMRIRLKAALIDVASGRWSMLTPEPVDDSALSSGLTRVSSDQKQVQLLKQKGYAVLASELTRYFAL